MPPRVERSAKRVLRVTQRERRRWLLTGLVDVGGLGIAVLWHSACASRRRGVVDALAENATNALAQSLQVCCQHCQYCAARANAVIARLN